MKKFWIIIIIFLGLIVWLYISNADFTPQSDKNKIFLEKIEKLESKIDSLNSQKDSIITVIDSTHIKIITNEKHYQEVVNTIIIAPDSDNLKFFKDYIKEYETNNKE